MACGSILSRLFHFKTRFTGWSSERDPTHVFTLLQTVYHAFDRVAKKRSVFKVETIGDCYIAVTGLPDPQEDHAVRMAKVRIEFIRDLLKAYQVHVPLTCFVVCCIT